MPIVSYSISVVFSIEVGFYVKDFPFDMPTGIQPCMFYFASYQRCSPLHVSFVKPILRELFCIKNNGHLCSLHLWWHPSDCFAQKRL